MSSELVPVAGVRRGRARQGVARRGLARHGKGASAQTTGESNAEVFGNVDGQDAASDALG